jgi:hypothetical protein
MPSGGRRPGSGRKPSVVTAATQQRIRLRSRELLDQAAQEGIMPITVMLESMRHLWSEARRDGTPDTNKMMAACSVAAQCAPYVHPRLSTLQATVENVGGMSDMVFQSRLSAVLDSLAALSVPDEFVEDEPAALPSPASEDAAE